MLPICHLAPLSLAGREKLHWNLGRGLVREEEWRHSQDTGIVFGCGQLQIFIYFLFIISNRMRHATKNTHILLSLRSYFYYSETCITNRKKSHCVLCYYRALWRWHNLIIIHIYTLLWTVYQCLNNLYGWVRLWSIRKRIRLTLVKSLYTWMHIQLICKRKRKLRYGLIASRDFPSSSYWV